MHNHYAQVLKFYNKKGSIVWGLSINFRLSECSCIGCKEGLDLGSVLILCMMWDDYLMCVTMYLRLNVAPRPGYLF